MRRSPPGPSSDGDTSPVEAPHVEFLHQGAESTSHASTQRELLDQRPSLSIASQPTATNWIPEDTRNGVVGKLLSSVDASTLQLPRTSLIHAHGLQMDEMEEKAQETRPEARRPPRLRSNWAITLLALVISIAGIGVLLAILHSSVTRQVDPKGCRMSYMRPSYTRLNDFDTEHTRLASKYSLYLYREYGVDHDTKVRGVPVLFIPGNAGSYKQVRSLASEAANYFHDVLQHDEAAVKAGVRRLDFFAADFNEDFTAFHGQTLLDQAEYLNEAIRYILSLYLDPRVSNRPPDLPDPTSVIVIGHSMGGIVARTMLVMPNYQSNSINTIITMSAPHARPPVSFDAQIVDTYREINNYWRHAYSQQWANNNPLWHVTLVSIAGGGLDTVVPSDYASVESLVPDTHGFTVFTSTIPTVWTSMDHLAITWCDQLRKVVARAVYDIVDVHRASQTKPRAERMRLFRKWFLTGMEPVVEKTAPGSDPSTLLTVGDNLESMIRQGGRLVVSRLGSTGVARAHLLPIPPTAQEGPKRFTLLTDLRLDRPGENGKIEVMLCRGIVPQGGHAGLAFTNQMDLSRGSGGATRLACKNAAADSVAVPSSRHSTKHPFYRDGEREIEPFTYLQYELDDISAHQFVVVVEKATSPAPGFVIAEFGNSFQEHGAGDVSLWQLLTSGLTLRLPPTRPLVNEVKVPSLQSGLFAYNLKIHGGACGGQTELFAPLVRQYLAEPYESKYFVNAREVTVSLHGVAPYLPPPLKKKTTDEGLTFQFWTDPTCGSDVRVELTVDILGSLGKLYMRYRTIFASFPLLVVMLVLRKQFRVYDMSGVFIPFSESLDLCLRQSIPMMLLSLTFLTLATAGGAEPEDRSYWHWKNGTSSAIDFYYNDYLIGTPDPLFLFLVPLIGIVCIGACTILNYAALALTYLLRALVGILTFRPGWLRNDEGGKNSTTTFSPCSLRRRVITLAALLFLVSTVIPYQFAYVVACLIQLATAVKAQRVASEARSISNSNFYNYVHTIFVLMLWILPINIPTLVVWVRNLAVHWLTPFTSHHNVLSIMPFVILVETLTAGKMIPQVTSRLRHVTSAFLFGIALYAAVYGVSYAYTLHYLANLVAAWLVAVHSTSDSWSLSGLNQLYEDDPIDQKMGKEP